MLPRWLRHTSLLLCLPLLAACACGGDAGPGDNAPPAPRNFRATEVTPSGITFEWDPVTDEGGGEVGYRIYEMPSGNRLYDSSPGSVAHSVTNSFENPPPAGTTLTFVIRSVDLAGNESSSSAPISVVVPTAVDTTPPSAPTNPRVAYVGEQSYAFTWDPSTDDRISVTYHLYQMPYEVWMGRLGRSSPSTMSIGGTPGASYSLVIKAVDGSGNVSAASVPFTLTLHVP